jgi:hypothetical protein
MQSWQQFYEMLGGAAATLLGLLFVSVSLNAETILGPAHKHSKRLAEQAFQNYLAVLMVSLFAAYPEMGPVSLGYTLIWVAGIWGAWAVSRVVPSLAEHRDTPSFGSARRYLATLTGFGVLVYGGWRMISEKSYHADYIAIGAIILLVSATVVSWDLLIKLAQEKYRDPPP